MDTSKIIKKIKSKIGDFVPDIAIIFGSGFGDIDAFQKKFELDYTELDMPKSKVSGHSGKFTFCEYEGKKLVLCTRYHFYEEKDMGLVRLPLFIANALGAKMLIMQTSAGGVNTNYKTGDIIAINDHINLSGDNPILAINPLKFVNMNNCYDETLLQIAHDCAKLLKINLKDGVHVQMSGPTYETKAEIDAVRKLGADTVSMSTAYDTIIARYLDMKVLAFAVVTNETGNNKEATLSHEEVKANSKLAQESFVALIKEILKRL